MQAQFQTWQRLLTQATPEEAALLTRSCRPLARLKGEEIWLEEDEPARVFIVQRGFVRLCRMSHEGKRLILSIFGPGDVFGALSPVAQTTSDDAYYEVVQHADMHVMAAEVFHQVLRQNPVFSLAVVEVLEQQKRSLDKRLSALLFKDVYSRTADLLLDVCSHFGEACPDHQGEIRDINLTQQEIADLVGASRPVVSSAINVLIKAGVLRKHQKMLCLHRWDMLEAVSRDGLGVLEN